MRQSPALSVEQSCRVEIFRLLSLDVSDLDSCLSRSKAAGGLGEAWMRGRYLLRSKGLSTGLLSGLYCRVLVVNVIHSTASGPSPLAMFSATMNAYSEESNSGFSCGLATIIVLAVSRQATQHDMRGAFWYGTNGPSTVTA